MSAYTPICPYQTTCPLKYSQPAKEPKKMSTPLQKGNKPVDDNPDPSGHFEAYFEYNKALRTWFVAFGVGGPAMFLIHGDLARALQQSGNLKCVVGLFLTGAAAQITGTLINKICNWYMFYETVDPTVRNTVRFRIAEWLIHQF